MAESPLHIADDLVSIELFGRDVDRNGDAVVLTLPGCTLSAGFFEHPSTYRHDQTIGLKRWNEVIGLDNSPRRVTPAKQRLDTREGSARQIEGGLVDQEELVGPEGGFAADEVERARAAGAHAISLGRRILRTETAALVVLAAALYARGEL